MTFMKIAAVGLAASLLAGGVAQAAPVRADGAMPVAAVAAKKLQRSSAPVAKQSKDAAPVLLGIAAAGALGVGFYEIVKDDSSGS